LNNQYAGTWKYFFENGKPERLVSYQDGLPEGKILVYNESGFLVQEGSYHLGKEDGEWNFFSGNGQLKFIGSYSAGKEIGIWYEYKKGQRKVYKKY